jgi:hypothetical protein
MMEVVGDLDFARAYIDDILIISNGTFEDHMAKLDQVLARLEQAGFRANVRKCFFGEQEIEYLGYWLTRQGIQPQPKKVEAILRISPPKTKRQLRRFIGMVNFYRDMWKRRSHILAPLTSMVSKDVPFKWGSEQQEAFDEMKRVMSQETPYTPLLSVHSRLDRKKAIPCLSLHITFLKQFLKVPFPTSPFYNILGNPSSLLFYWNPALPFLMMPLSFLDHCVLKKEFLVVFQRLFNQKRNACRWSIGKHNNKLLLLI